MARLSLIAFLALAFSNVALAAPHDLGVVSDLQARGGNQPYTPCGDPDAILSLNVSPDPPESGETMFVYVGVEARETVVEDSYATVIVSHGPQFLWSQRVDVCQGKCPISSGPYTFYYTVNLPGHIPPSELNIVTQGNSPEGKPLFCFAFEPIN